MWVVRGSGDNRETVEAGWQKYRNLYGDYRPRLFIYFTPDNYGDDGHPSLNDSRTNSDCYDIDLHDSDGFWERYFYFGGPGFNSHCR